MNAKRFFYISAGLFLLAAAYSLGARDATATYVDHAGGGPVVAATYSGTLLRSDGQVWYYRLGDAEPWARVDWNDPLPVPISDIAFYGEVWLVTRTGVLWQVDTSRGATPYPWANRGQIPLPPVSIDGRAWGTVKNAYRK